LSARACSVESLPFGLGVTFGGRWVDLNPHNDFRRLTCFQDRPLTISVTFHIVRCSGFEPLTAFADDSPKLAQRVLRGHGPYPHESHVFIRVIGGSHPTGTVTCTLLRLSSATTLLILLRPSRVPGSMARIGTLMITSAVLMDNSSQYDHITDFLFRVFVVCSLFAYPSISFHTDLPDPSLGVSCLNGDYFEAHNVFDTF
jgi:hypothetical protein